MNFKQATNEHPSFKTIYEKLIIKTAMGREMLFNLEFSTDKDWLEKQYSLTEDCQNFISHIKDNDKMLFECVLYDIHNISGSIILLKNGEILDDIGLFELKAFCLACKKLQGMIKPLQSEEFHFASLQDIISLLDPEGLEVNQFYIFPAYREGLAEKRKLFEQYKKEDSPEANVMYNEIMEIENEVREELCKKLRPHSDRILKEINRVALLDISIAKAELNIELNLVKPSIASNNTIKYTKIFNPIVKEALNKKGKDFQAIDIEVSEKPILITGANMAGKTVVLKTLALSQLMIQFGMFSPCEKCEVALFDNVLTSIGDKQNENEGLSSFASEILGLDNIIKQVKTQKPYLVLVDELARTTNPVEGVKLLNGFITTVSQGKSLTVVTTHYSNIKAEAKRLRVKGFINRNLQAPISLDNLSDNIDYSLIPDDSVSVPNEAINLCRLLGIDQDWLHNAE